MIRHFVSDLDGTLLNGKFEWDAVISEGISQVLERGFDFAVATGRTISGIKNCPGLWELPVYLILMNGALVLDPKREIIFSREVSRKTRELILDLYPGGNLEFICREGMMTPLDRDTYLQEYSQWDLWRKKVLDKKESGYYDAYLRSITFGCTRQELLDAQILKVNGIQLDDVKYQRLLQSLEQHLTDAVNAPFADHVIEITDRDASKAKALAFLSELLGWKEEETAVFGDSGNDIEMLDSWQHSFAPENASEEAKIAAKELVAANENYGVIRKIQELLKGS